MHTSSMRPSITPLYVHLGVPHYPHPPLFQLKFPHQALLEWSIRHEVQLALWNIQTCLFIHSFQKFFTCTLNRGFHLFRMSKRILAKYKCTKLKVSAAKKSLKGHFNLSIKVKRKNRGNEINMTAWLQGQFGLLLHCAAEMPEPRLLDILITDYFTP